ncbi:WhiB family transcriptional regulator [Crossiella sp. CA-258035]|uniref:WhiB family transcriptional regulator n=1 Tax=Crossiella sp. CA-258035 TaxID=2981138 RepID=UPI0024BCD422|nr:WhiB family transcriptional regulator [Crossiella sp. CA-258035]WHT21896.1 WhiB family transcriptional regulator [Crossiella sp. CA-258035]
MTAEERLQRGSELWRLLGQLRAEDFGGHAECAGTDPELFFPSTTFEGRTLASETERVEQAKAICGRCEIAESCRDFAVRTGQRGIWGGTDELDRAELRQAQPAVVPVSELPAVA